ncbi:hypothetical protein ABZ297_05400 [Nonomuraea sp. NPDC005983]|uniref:hypothetical protein n=1 Tax=Nonomuraea sp. NPDC005983 TaxID=3155595 RepID=UPI0033BD3B1D
MRTLTAPLTLLALVVILFGGQSSADVATAEHTALIGVSGLRWHDLGPASTPNLWGLLSASATGSLSVRTIGPATCPADAWLTISAGVRSAVGGRCGAPSPPRRVGEGALVSPASGRYAGAAGSLGQSLHQGGKCTTAIGPGAAVALADREGQVDQYAASSAELTPAAWGRCPVIAVDVADLAAPYLASGYLADEGGVTGQRRAEAVRSADAKVGEVLRALPSSTTLLVAGISDDERRPHLRVAMMRAPGTAGRWLGSDTTRRDDMVILPDITATVLKSAGLPPLAASTGLPWKATSLREADVRPLVDADMAAQIIRDLGMPFFTAFAIIQGLFYLVAHLLLRRGRGLSLLRVLALTVAALPVSTYLANLLPWTSGAALVGGALVIDAAIVAVALTGPWRRSLLGCGAVVAGITATVLAADLATGTNLQLNAIMGYTGVVGARYHGMGNIPAALFAASVLYCAVALGQWLASRGRRRSAIATVIGLGAACLGLEAMPGVGSKFGGTIGFVSGIAVAALLASGRRLSPLRLMVVGASGAAVALGIAFLDHLRPLEQQTHLGRFVTQALDGDALPEIQQKLEAMLRTFGNLTLLPIVLAALAFLVYALRRPGKVTAGALPLAFDRAPMLRAGLAGCLTSGVIGTLASDSGIAVLSMTLALAVPLALLAGVQALQSSPRTITLSPSPKVNDSPLGGLSTTP